MAAPPVQVSPRPSSDAEVPVSARSDGHSAMSEVLRGGEVLLSRLGEVGSANADLRRQLELQAREIRLLDEAGQGQRQLLQEVERVAEHGRQAFALEAAARARAEGAESERRMQVELVDARAEMQRGRDELLESLQQAEVEARERKGELDVAHSRLANAEARIDASGGVAADTGARARVKALEMELNLMSARLSREATARQMAEGDLAAAKAKLKNSRADIERSAAEHRRLQTALAERGELAEFRQEIIDDLGMRFKQQSADAENKLERERGKIAVARRLESILPKHILAKAFA